MITKSTFRCDIQALRALAVLLVVGYHYGLPGFHGGFFGVDIFFVLSGYVITKVLLREQEQTSGISLLNFYARRIRRILPAATVVLVVTVFATYHFLSYITGGINAVDGEWVALFAGNFHFAQLGTNYFTSNIQPSTLQQYWSLAVEEQFYLVWPVLLIEMVSLSKPQTRTRVLSLVLLALFIASLAWCIIETKSNPGLAFFSPLTRAWELALGALIAVTEPWVVGRAPRLGRALVVMGGITLVVCTWYYTSATLWPGAAALAPVFATAAMVLGGSLIRIGGLSQFVSWRPVLWFGDVSYSWYLVHWPILTIATQYAFSPLSLPKRAFLSVLSLLVAAVLYYLVDKPIRSWRWLRMHRANTYALGAFLIAGSYGVILWHIHHY